jgi:hypothetical protein
MSDPYRSHRPQVSTELKATQIPNVAERIIRSVMHVVAIVLMTLTALLVLSVVQALGRLGEAVDQLRTPAPAVTDCVGELEC